MRRMLGIAIATVFLVLTHAAPAHAWAHLPYRLSGSSVTYYLEYTITDHSSWPGLIAQYILKWREAEPASPQFVRGYDSNLAPIYVYQGRLQDPTWCGVQSPGRVSGSTLVYTSIGYTNQKGFGTSGSNATTCDFIHTTVHEYGHALGLEHTTWEPAVMYKILSVPRHALSSDDVTSITRKY